MASKQKNKFEGSRFEDFLKDEKVFAEAHAAAVKEVLVWQLGQEMKKMKINKTEMAKKMKTSRAAVDRLLDPDNDSLTLKNLEKAALVFNKTIKIELCNLK